MINITITDEAGHEFKLSVVAYLLSVLHNPEDLKQAEYMDWDPVLDGRIVFGNKYTRPRYDEVYEEGMKKLDKL